MANKPDYLAWLAGGFAACLAIASFPAAAAETNPCADKHWLAEPVLALAPSAPRQDEEQGIGGTGHQLAPTTTLAPASGDDDEGIGGTGIVGVIAGFASICVNGQEIHFQSDTPTQVDGTPARADKLALGQTVAVRAVPVAGGYQAHEIQVWHEVRGPVESIDLGAGAFTVLNQRVQAPASLLFQVAVGDRVAVSGSRMPDGQIRPLRIEVIAIEAGVDLIGPVTGLVDGGIVMAGQIVRLPPGAAKPALGSEVMARGQMLDGEFRAERLTINPRLAFSVPVERVHLQGYVRQPTTDGLDVDGIQLRQTVLQAAVPTPGSRIVIEARVAREGGLAIERWSLARPLANERRPQTNAPANVPAHTLPSKSLPDAQRPPRDSEGRGTERRQVDIAPALVVERLLSEPDNLQRPDMPRTDQLRQELPRMELPRLLRPDFQRPEIPTRPLRPERPILDRPRPEMLRPLR